MRVSRQREADAASKLLLRLFHALSRHQQSHFLFETNLRNRAWKTQTMFQRQIIGAGAGCQ